MRNNKADVIAECVEATFKVEGFNASLDGGHGVTRLLLEIRPFLGVEGLIFSFLRDRDYHLKKFL